MGKKILRNVAVPDGVDGFIYLENIILTPACILIINIKRFKGVIFADDKIDVWTQVIDRGSFKFDNPFIQMDEDVASVKALLSGSDVSGLLVFTDESEFPKGKPDRIMSLVDLKAKSCKRDDKVPDKLQEDWGKLLQAIGQS